MSRWRRTLVLTSCLALVPLAGRAQISPGRLSRPHARLEGSSHCLECHDPRQGVSAPKCLACHQPLQRRIAAGKGLHARPEYRDCKTCHVEHQGTEYQLVWWGKQGQAAFDHAQTGYPLAGRHLRLSCGECHKQRSFLGSPVDCAGCHKDVHQGEFQGRSCSSCHSQVAWEPAPGFDHAKTSWPLSGRHLAVACERCHATARPAAAVAAAERVFRAVAGRDCASCHRDVHQGRFGSSCSRRHLTYDWRGVQMAALDRNRFDHDKTSYPLRGRHVSLACASCHLPGKPLRLEHSRCTDCHRDAHRGELTRRADQGRCESCHDVNGFRPARFGVEEHARTAYPLLGAHLAVACDACHQRPRDVTAARTASTRPAPRLRFATTRCADCHRDPHRGELARFMAKGGCQACHRVESWRQVSFDHAQTRFVLDGAHVRARCDGCHRRADAGGAAPDLHLAGVPQACAACHRDPHAGQFISGNVAISCERCHGTDSFQASRFDHARDSRYKLDGAHARLACSACHRSETREGRTFVRYKPLPTTCRGCHASEPARGGRS